MDRNLKNPPASKFLKYAIFSAFAGWVALGTFTHQSLANPVSPVIEVKVDRAKVMRIPRPAAMVIVGNPAIADATVKDSQTLIITGKQYGNTNLIALDSDGEPIADEIINVTAAVGDNIVVYKGAARRTLTCSPNCEPVIRIGDDPNLQNVLAQQIKVHKDMSQGDDVDLPDSE